MDKIETLIEDYERRLKTLKEMIEDTDQKELATLERLKVKHGCYNSFLAELKRSNPENDEPAIEGSTRGLNDKIIEYIEGSVEIVEYKNGTLSEKGRDLLLVLQK